MYKKFEVILGKENVLKDEPMSKHTTFRIGGTADVFLLVETEEQLKKVISIVNEQEVPYLILGNGSNILVGDKGIRGVVICLYKKMDSIFVDGERITAQCGALLSRVAARAANEGLAGLEFASGIPGTIGGAVYMNAGAYGPEMKDVVEFVRYMDKNGEIHRISSAECDFGYRKSVFTNSENIILDCTLKLKEGDKEEIRKLMNELTQRRNSKQPVDKASAGSVFKRPEGYFAGGLIEEAGLKGYSVGAAQVSEKHAGFIINNGGAKADDVLQLIKHIESTIYEKNGVMLETEVKMVGEF